MCHRHREQARFNGLIRVNAAEDLREAVFAHQGETQHIQIFDERNEAHTLELPTSALRLLVDILAELAAGNVVKVVPVHAERCRQWISVLS